MYQLSTWLIKRAVAQSGDPYSDYYVPGTGPYDEFHPGNNPPTDFQSLVRFIIDTVLNPLILLFTAAALAYFLYGVLKYIRHAGDQAERAESIKMMTYGVVALFVMVSVWGLVNLLTGTFDLTNSAPPIPRL